MLCADCIAALNYTNQEFACLKCGAPFGSLICTECYTREGKVLQSFNMAACALSLDELAGRIIVLYKDNNERRLAGILAKLMNQALPALWPHWTNVISWIPVDKKTFRRRGFDHMEHIAKELAQQTGLTAEPLLSKQVSKDQRRLNREERIQNLKESFSLIQKAEPLPQHILLIDDVYTTGSTLEAASLALLEGGAQEVRALCIARAW
ncbi:MAG: ComF family protein [Coriobacteriia bacterium]|nr:ComF family protein [Coriobacteriia bacterium]MCL2750746.1 ComF family protein [Coriobacteriia bacterium]